MLQVRRTFIGGLRGDSVVVGGGRGRNEERLSGSLVKQYRDFSPLKSKLPMMIYYLFSFKIFTFQELPERQGCQWTIFFNYKNL